jgi:hypothetical protein
MATDVYKSWRRPSDLRNDVTSKSQQGIVCDVKPARQTLHISLVFVGWRVH